MQSPLFKNNYRVLSARRPGWDYTDDARYFVTIVTGGRILYFGDIKNSEMILSPIGAIVRDEWLKTQQIRKNVRLDEWVIMPNHVHMILEIIKPIVESSSVETPRWGVLAGRNLSGMIDDTISGETETPQLTMYGETETPQRGVSTWKPHSLGSIINQFKSAATKRIRQSIMPNFIWQPRFHDRIIRDELELGRIRKYINENPMKWENDELYI